MNTCNWEFVVSVLGTGFAIGFWLGFFFAALLQKYPKIGDERKSGRKEAEEK